jgi:hypothetical protein
VVEPLAVLCLPHHESLDRSSVDGDTDGARIREAAGRFAGAGGYLQVLNHPDINIAELFELLSEVPREGRWDVPAVEVAAWWRATHVTGELALRSAGGRFTVEARGDLDGLVVEVLEPDGTVNVSVVGAPTFAATLPP